MIAARILALAGGAVVMAIASHVNITATGGYGTPHAYITIAAAIGLVVGSLLFHWVWASWASLAVVLVVCMLSGEAYQIISTQDRLAKSREADKAPRREYQKTYQKAEKRLADAQKAVDNPPTTSKALESANKSKASADAAVVEKAAEKFCRSECRQMLEKQVETAAAEVQKATAAIEARKTKAKEELDAARAALDGLKAPESVTALADQTGIPAWIIDVSLSALGSIAVNGIACCLLMFGAHPARSRVEVVTPQPRWSATEPNPTKRKKPASEKEHAARFGLACLRPGGEADLEAIRSSYRAWSALEAPSDRPSEPRMAKALAQLFDDAGLIVVERGGRLVVLGVSIKQALGEG